MSLDGAGLTDELVVELNPADPEPEPEECTEDAEAGE